MKLIRILLITMILLFNFSALAEAPRAVIATTPEVSTVKEGDIIEGMIKVWPLESAELDEFKKLENTTLMGMLKIVQVESIETSVNNSDVIEIKVVMAIVRTKNQSDYSLFYKGHPIAIEPLSFKLATALNPPKDYFILDQAISTSLIAEIIIAALLVLLLGFGFVKREDIKKWIKKFKADPVREQMNYFDLLFSHASSRQDFEQVYAQRKQWMNFLKEKNLNYDSFFGAMETHQYKKEWSEIELNEVSRTFEGLRGSFK